MEKIAESSTNIVSARSRLKSIAEKKHPVQQTPSDPRYTMADLGNMIDHAIEEHAIDNHATILRNISTQPSPQPTLIRRWKSARSPRKSIEDVVFHAPRDEIGGPKNASRPSSSHHVKQVQAESPKKDLPTSRVSNGRSQFDRSIPDASPVRQRAAVFEAMHQSPDALEQTREAPHDQHIHVKTGWSVVPIHEHTAEKERELHHLKFGRTMHDNSESSTTAALSRQVRDHGGLNDSSRETHDTFQTAKQSPQKREVSDDESLASRPPELTRKTSISWPFKWKPFSKGSSAPPRTNEDTVNATPKDERRPLARPSIVKSKVQELLKRDEQEQDRRQADLEHKTKQPSRRPSRVIQSELGNGVPDPPGLKPARLPPLQVPVQEQAEMIAAPLYPTDASSTSVKGKMAKLEDSTETIKTPIHRSWAEKEVLNVSQPQPPSGPARSGSPLKPAPSTPIRGRSAKMGQSLSPRGSPYTTEHAFVLSPVPSRSPSRASGRAHVHKVEVEMRDSPEREARERGDKIMFVRTSAYEEDTE